MVSDDVIGRILLFFCLFSLPLLELNAQTNAAPGQIRPAIQILDSTKEQDGLVGSVRRVRTEYAKITLKEGRTIEGPRQLLEVTTYGVRGNRVENVSYPIADSAVGREEYKYDEQGNIIERVLRDDSGSVLSREAYDYVFDAVGNWTKMVTNLVVIEDGELKREPTEVTYRTLTYYAVDTKPRTIARSASDGSLATPETNIERSEKTVENAGNTTTSPNFLKVDEVKTQPIATSAPGEKKDEAPSGQPAVSQLQVDTPTETAGTNNDRSAEKPLATKQEPAPTENEHVVSPEPRATKTTKKGKFEDTASPLNTGNDAREAEKTVPTDNHLATGATVTSPIGSKASSTTTESPAANITSENPNPPNAVENATVTAESAATEASPASLTKALEVYRLGRQRFDAGDFSAAIAAYLESIRLEPNSAEIHLNLGHAYLTTKKDKDAAKAFREAVQLNPELAEAYYGLGFVSFRMSKYKEAMEAFKKATELIPEMAKAHYGLALAYQELGRADLVVRQYRLLQKLDPKLANKLMQAFPDGEINCRQSGTINCRIW